MRITVTLDDDVRQAVEELSRERGLGFSAALNELARRGPAFIDHAPGGRFRQATSAMGRPKIAIEDIGHAFDVVENPDFR